MPGPPKRVTVEERKAQLAALGKRRRAETVRIREEIIRWTEIKEHYSLKSDPEVAKLLLDSLLSGGRDTRKQLLMRNVRTQTKKQLDQNEDCASQTVLTKQDLDSVNQVYNDQMEGEGEKEEERENSVVTSKRWRCLKSVLKCKSDTDLSKLLIDWFVTTSPLMKCDGDQLTVEQLEAAETSIDNSSKETDPYLLTMKVTSDQDRAIQTFCTLRGWTYDPDEVLDLTDATVELDTLPKLPKVIKIRKCTIQKGKPESVTPATAFRMMPPAREQEPLIIARPRPAPVKITKKTLRPPAKKQSTMMKISQANVSQPPPSIVHQGVNCLSQNEIEEMSKQFLQTHSQGPTLNSPLVMLQPAKQALYGVPCQSQYSDEPRRTSLMTQMFQSVGTIPVAQASSSHPFFTNVQADAATNTNVGVFPSPTTVQPMLPMFSGTNSVSSAEDTKMPLSSLTTSSLETDPHVKQSMSPVPGTSTDSYSEYTGNVITVKQEVEDMDYNT